MMPISAPRGVWQARLVNRSRGVPVRGWPVELIAVRHGESLTNLAFPAADAAGLEDGGVPGSDGEVPLTGLGEIQSRDLGTWLASRSPRPDVVLSSPYRRARQTTDIALEGLRQLTGRAPEVTVDERLRDRELGILEMQTRAAVKRRFPEEVARRQLVGEFLYRPAGGESFADVALRVRSLLRDLRDDFAGRRVLIVGHDAIVLLLRYLIEGIPHGDVLGLGPVFNCSVTRWAGGEGSVRLVEYNIVQHLSPR
jgi:2,3-bisphosphoglycerate-dependent phosphoglycerate mutase